MSTIVWVIFAGLTNLTRSGLRFSAGCIYLRAAFFLGSRLGAADLGLRLLGLLQRQFFCGRGQEPEKTIPRAIILSIALVAVIYIVMNISILGVIPWREFADIANNDACVST